MEEKAVPTRDLIGRVYLALSVALVAGAGLGLIVGFIGANQCTAEGLACLGWIVYGIFGGVLVALIVAVVILRKMHVAWLTAGAIVVGIVLLGALSMAFSEASGVLILAALVWPALVIAGRARSTRGRAILGGGFAALLIVGALGTTWMGESRSIEMGAESYARSQVQVWGPANDAVIDRDSIVVIVSPSNQSLNYSYDSGGQSVDVLIRHEPGSTPGEGQVVTTDQDPRATSVRHGEDVVEIRVLDADSSDRLIEAERSLATSFVRRSPTWLAGLDESLHRLLGR